MMPLRKTVILLTVIVLAIDLSMGTIEPFTQQTLVTFKSHYGTYLRGNSDRSIELDPNVMRQEKWTIIPFDVQKYLLRSSSDTYLSAAQNMSLTLIDEARDQDIWTREESYWKSYYGTYLSGDSSGAVTLKSLPEVEEEWEVNNTLDLPPFVVSIISTHGTFLRKSTQDRVWLVSDLQEDEKWELIKIDNSDEYFLKSSDGTYLSGRRENTVFHVNKARQWERWTRVTKGTVTYWKSFHGTYLSANNSGEVTLKVKPGAWEQWAIGLQINIVESYVALQSVDKNYLSARYNRSPDFGSSLLSLERWQFIYQGGFKYTLKSALDTYLRAYNDGTIGFSLSPQNWTLIVVETNTIYLMSVFGTCMSGDQSTGVSLQPFASSTTWKVKVY